MTVAFTMIERADQLQRDYAPAISTAVMQAFCQSIKSPRSVSSHTAKIWLPATLAFPKAKIAGERETMCECDGDTVHKLGQWRLTVK